MYYKIIHNDKVEVENYVSEKSLAKTIKNWKNEGMSGSYKAFPHTLAELNERIW